ncbi:MAG TPA: PAS domain-containing sensor histidine kinase [Geopsychrobacteraceae bacterium]|nr:PAS domain-containing sensor histidine kinase [Geopsychrobacteraceae bacterium]
MKSDKDKGVAKLRRRAEDHLKSRRADKNSSLSAVETERLLHELRVHQIELEMQNKELQIAREETERLLERYTDLYDFAPVGYFTLEQNGVIADTNLAGAQLLGQERAALSGKRLATFVSEPDRPILATFLQIISDTPALRSCQVDLDSPGQPLRTVKIDADLAVDGLSCRAIMTDITSEEAARKALIEIDQIRNDFVSMAAHELRTPLTVIMGFAELLLNPEASDPITEEQKQEYINDIYQKGSDLSRRINDLLDVSLIQQETEVTLNLTRCDLNDILTETVHSFQLSNPARTFRLELPAKAGRTITADRHRITQVLDNLLSNTAKYSPADSEVVITGRQLPADCEVRIKDHGIGMTPEQIEKIFDKFYRADSANTAISGLGLGMNIAHQIIRAHGGNIQVESVKGQGTAVVFTLPYSAD